MTPMTRTALAVALLATPIALAEEAKPAASAHVAVTAPEVKWGPGSPALPPGAQMAVLVGDPGATGPFVLRVKLPAGYKIPAHWHPTDENVTVLEGTFSAGMGDVFDMKALHALPAGSYAKMPAEMRHFAYTEKGATVQVHGMAPFALNYVNPKDDPRNAAPASPRP